MAPPRLLHLGSLTFDPSQRDMSGTMGFSEFKELSQVLNGWKTTFCSYDRDRSGTVEGNELQMALTSMGEEGATAAMERAHSPAQHALPPSDSAPLCLSVCLSSGFNLSPQAMNVVMRRFSVGGRIAFDDFISACIKLRALTGE